MRSAALILLTLAALAVAAPASASELIDRNATDVSLIVDKHGRALVGYTVRGKSRKVLVWGALNAVAPTDRRSQGRFKKDYAGGWGAFRTLYWKSMKNVCGPYTGPELPWFVKGCTAPDGSHWALQSWQKMLPNLGHDPWKDEQKAWELHLSHWKGDLPKIEVWTDWVYSKRFHHLFGRFTYLGKPVFGFKTTNTGDPLDRFGRNMYLDTLDSAYGAGWRRENSFVAHNPTGVFCYGFYEHPPYAGYPAGIRPQGFGKRYRITAMGPGVTPVVMWEGPGVPAYDKLNPEHLALEDEMNALQRSFGDPLCRQN